VRELQAVMSHQGLVIMGGNAAVATAMANHWKAERKPKPCNVLLQFLGEAVDHEAAQAAQADPLVRFREAVEDSAAFPCPQAPPDSQQVALLCEAALPRLVAIIAPKFQEVLNDALGSVQALLNERLPTQSARAIVNVNCSGRDAADLDRVNLAFPTTAADIASVKHGTLHVSRFLRQHWNPEWQRGGLSPSNVQASFSHLVSIRKLQELARHGQVPKYAGQINRQVLSRLFFTDRSNRMLGGGTSRGIRGTEVRKFITRRKTCR